MRRERKATMERRRLAEGERVNMGEPDDGEGDEQ
jgi:hypothetical protein